MELKSQTFKSLLYPCKLDNYSRVGHRCLQKRGQILVFGGTGAASDLTVPSIKIGCDNFHVDTFHLKRPLFLDGFSLFQFQNSMYAWGGMNFDRKFDNQMWSLRQDLTLLPCSGSIPKGRYYHASTLIYNRFLLIFGGMNSTQIFNDWYLLDCTNFSWKQLNTNIVLPMTLNPSLFWTGGRGFLILHQYFDPHQKQVLYCNDMYEVRFTDNQLHTIKLQLIATCSQKRPEGRGSPSMALIQLQSPYLFYMGGQRIGQAGNGSTCGDIWLFNIQTLEWIDTKIKLTVRLGFQIAYYQEKIYLIGGITQNNNLSGIIEVIDLNVQKIQSKVCHSCRDIYGIKAAQEPKGKSFMFKFEQNLQKTVVCSTIINKLALTIKNPLTAFGLLMDNCLNLGATLLSIDFKRHNETNGCQNYLTLCDNSNGFKWDQILQSVHSMSLKIETLTSDHKYEQQLSIRKQYGVNLKLAALRLGQSCLLVAKTLDNQIFVCLFSTTKQYFTIYYYFITNQEVSSQINRDIIANQVKGYLPNDYEKIDQFTTKIYIYHLRQQLFAQDDPLTQIIFRYSQNNIFKNLKIYLQSLYLQPYVGRTIRLQNEQMKPINYIERFKKDEMDQKIMKISLKTISHLFSKICLYFILQNQYVFDNVLIYHQNRLITSISCTHLKLCGYIQIPQNIYPNVCKTRFERLLEQNKLNQLIQKIAATRKKSYSSRDPPLNKKIKTQEF